MTPPTRQRPLSHSNVLHIGTDLDDLGDGFVADSEQALERDAFADATDDGVNRPQRDPELQRTGDRTVEGKVSPSQRPARKRRTIASPGPRASGFALVPCQSTDALEAQLVHVRRLRRGRGTRRAWWHESNEATRHLLGSSSSFG
jgi:hypothetical protein